MGLAAFHGILVDDDPDDGGIGRDLIHDGNQQFLHHAAQTTGAALALDGLFGNGMEGCVGELQFSIIQAEQLL